MTNTHSRITREELYQQVWSTPTTILAKTLGVSDVAIAKVCKKLNVPKPPPGYWRKVETGHRSSPPPLPTNHQQGRPTGVMVRPSSKAATLQPHHPGLVERITFENQPENRIYVAADGFIEGPPELVAEVASSSVAYDLHQKLDVYRRHGVREYIVWRTLDTAIDWFVLRDGRYERLSPREAGIYKSESFPGLWLEAAAMLQGDLAGVLKTLGEGIASPEHTEFVQRLTQTI